MTQVHHLCTHHVSLLLSMCLILKNRWCIDGGIRSSSAGGKRCDDRLSSRHVCMYCVWEEWKQKKVLPSQPCIRIFAAREVRRASSYWLLPGCLSVCIHDMIIHLTSSSLSPFLESRSEKGIQEKFVFSFSFLLLLSSYPFGLCATVLRE